MAAPLLPPDELQTQQTFTALMWALSYPGRLQQLPAAGLDAFAAIAAALLDLETSYFTPDTRLEPILLRSGARRLDPAEARYQFYPQLGAAELALLQHAPIGSHSYPDESATLIIGCKLGQGSALHLHGPGIPGSAALYLAELPPAFWNLRMAQRYPLGWDLFLVDGANVVGLPRSTRIEFA